VSRLRARDAGVACLLALAAPARSASAAEPTPILVLGLRPIGLSEEQAQLATTQLVTAVARDPQWRVVTRDELAQLLEHQKTLDRLQCADSACLAEVAGLLHTTLALNGSIGRVGGSTIVSLALLDAARSKVVGSADWILASPDELPGVLPELLARLLSGLARPSAPSRSGAPSSRFSVADHKALSVAVLDLRPSGIPDEDAANLTQVLAVELKRTRNLSVISHADIASMLAFEARKEMLGCTEAACLAEIGGTLGVQKLVTGQVGLLGGRYVVTLRLMDVAAVRVDNRVTESFRGVKEQLIPAVRTAARRLLGVDSAEPGTLAFSASRADALVRLDDQDLGRLPLRPRTGVAPGTHAVGMTREGFHDWQSDVFVEPGQTTAVYAEMTEIPPKWYQTWWFWTGVAVVAGGSAAGIVLLTRERTGSLHVSGPLPGDVR